ncbi:GGDEF domain-containing response regulator [Aminipila luticellarii]|uniref:Stage 0 sporulation protein A homolog n=1 Tax=Aminipila luticellarii TaxID=2507160 RepID=A0A410PXT2_9FIRM|nr:diguanylate cyclase [Aminipila luticellarii]QAT43656.1 diguanylate cyclase [Aminipila luticellarii]
METILIVDDSFFNIQLLKGILQKDYNIIYASDGEKGLEIAKVMQPSLILLDVEMPGLNGFQVMERLQSLKETQQIPVVFLTGVDDTATEEKAFFCGAVDYIRKPFCCNVVCARVRTHINMFKYRQMLEAQMYIDVLTGLYTRKHCIDHVNKQWKQCIQDKTPFSLGIADIDFFKRVNDTYGHQEGDRVLNNVANIMKQSMPEENNYIARVGGEEFFLILTSENRDRVSEVIQHVCKAVGQKCVCKAGGNSDQEINVTISIGGSTIIPSERDSLDDFIAIADQMLYKAKNNGRNRVVWI